VRRTALVLTLLTLVLPAAARAGAPNPTATPPASCHSAACVGSGAQSGDRPQRPAVSRVKDASSTFVTALLLALLLIVLVIVTLQRQMKRAARGEQTSAPSSAPQPPIRLVWSRRREERR
jgi:hypothetical protein